jgi:hypothetical protein
VPIVHSPAPDKRTGLGDIQPSFFLTPSRGGAWSWGIGPALLLPTATNKVLGTGKWSVGPTAAVLYSEGPWFDGVLVAHLWSFAGPHRLAVNQTSIEPLVSYNFESGWSLQFDPTIVRDWTADSRDAWTLPVGLDIGKTLQTGNRSISFQIGAYDFARHPMESGRWLLRGQVTFEFERP